MVSAVSNSPSYGGTKVAVSEWFPGADWLSDETKNWPPKYSQRLEPDMSFREYATTLDPDASLDDIAALLRADPAALDERARANRNMLFHRYLIAGQTPVAQLTWGLPTNDDERPLSEFSLRLDDLPAEVPALSVWGRILHQTQGPLAVNYLEKLAAAAKRTARRDLASPPDPDAPYIALRRLPEEVAGKLRLHLFARGGLGLASEEGWAVPYFSAGGLTDGTEVHDPIAFAAGRPSFVAGYDQGSWYAARAPSQ